ncbi:MAG: family 16 glycoside hydrolase, partial [Planctomycetota bacterium]
RNGGRGSLEHLVRDPATADRYAHLVDGDGAWVVRDDVWISYFDRRGGLAPGYGSRDDRIGPELGFGHVVGDHFDEQVLLIKIAWGGKSLAKDFRPPSSGGEVGPFYSAMFEHVRAVLGDLGTHVPAYDGGGYEIVGFGWHQGWNDRVNQGFNDAYEENMANFIRDVRAELEIESLPFVLAETGMSGHTEKHPRALSLMRAQAAVAERDEFRGNVAFVGTKDFYRGADVSPSRQAYHWNNNAETYYLIGDGMGRAMLELLGAAPAPSLDPSQQRWYEQYTSQPNAPEPSAMLLNTDPEPDLTSGFTPLFNGTDLSGWTPRGGTCAFTVEDGSIVGTVVAGSQSTYLCTDRADFTDFVFTCEVKWDVDSNSGLMFRSGVRRGAGGREIVCGPQAEMEGFQRKRGWSGGIYGQSCGGYFYPLWLTEHARVRGALVENAWNRITIEATGNVVKTWVNGIPAAHWIDDGSYPNGFFGLQIHQGAKGIVRFRDIRIKDGAP